MVIFLYIYIVTFVFYNETQTVFRFYVYIISIPFALMLRKIDNVPWEATKNPTKRHLRAQGAQAKDGAVGPACPLPRELGLLEVCASPVLGKHF